MKERFEGIAGRRLLIDALKTQKMVEGNLTLAEELAKRSFARELPTMTRAMYLSILYGKRIACLLYPQPKPSLLLARSRANLSTITSRWTSGQMEFLEHRTIQLRALSKR